MRHVAAFSSLLAERGPQSWKSNLEALTFVSRLPLCPGESLEQVFI